MLLTDELLLNYKRCQRRSYLDVYGDWGKKNPERDFVQKLRQESNNHIQTVLEESSYYQPSGNREDWELRAYETRLLMQQGVERIYQGVLSVFGQQSLRSLLALFPEEVAQKDFDGVTFLGMPTLLIKQPGVSVFGNWQYIPVSVKLGRRPKPEYQIITAFHVLLLGVIQGNLPNKAELILRRQNSYRVNLKTWLPRMQTLLQDCLQMLQHREEPEVFISRQRCALCQWHSYCYTIAQSEEHLSLIPGVTPSRYQILQEAGLTTLEALAAATPADMGEGIEPETAFILQQQAHSLLSNCAIAKSSLNGKFPLPTAPIELYFDIEAEQERNVDYLLGVLLVNRQENTEQFYSFLAEKPDEEAIIWQHFIRFLSSYPDAPIFHFSEYEVETIKRLGNLYGTPATEIQSILSRLVDVHQSVIKYTILPVESYSLKSVANWLGFQWRDRGVGGDQCICWYDQWLKSGDRTRLDAILRYNEDDCRATRHLKDWLVDFLENCSFDSIEEWESLPQTFS